MLPNKIYQTNIFLRPGTQIHSINGLITNFHLPESSLLVLVSTLIGREKTLEIYREAIKERYRFFSYGDAMLILR
jgi:S-adenosylmethionine:tRNA ribosyltransferase-isomerase